MALTHPDWAVALAVHCGSEGAGSGGRTELSVAPLVGSKWQQVYKPHSSHSAKYSWLVNDQLSTSNVDLTLNRGLGGGGLHIAYVVSGHHAAPESSYIGHVRRTIDRHFKDLAHSPSQEANPDVGNDSPKMYSPERPARLHSALMVTYWLWNKVVTEHVRPHGFVSDVDC